MPPTRKSKKTFDAAPNSCAKPRKRSQPDWTYRKERLMLLYVFQQTEFMQPNYKELARMMGEERYSPEQLRRHFKVLQYAAREAVADRREELDDANTASGYEMPATKKSQSVVRGTRHRGTRRASSSPPATPSPRNARNVRNLRMDSGYGQGGSLEIETPPSATSWDSSTEATPAMRTRSRARAKLAAKGHDSRPFRDEERIRYFSMVAPTTQKKSRGRKLDFSMREAHNLDYTDAYTEGVKHCEEDYSDYEL